LLVLTEKLRKDVEGKKGMKDRKVGAMDEGTKYMMCFSVTASI
jgi:hypothetical protein